VEAVEFRPATLRDIGLITPREQDRTELWDGFHHTPEEALEYGISEGATFATLYGEPAAIFGCVDGVVPGQGIPWAIFTDAIERYPLTFLRHARGPIEAMKANRRELVNFVDARNGHVVKWLKWNGFTIHPATPCGVEQKPFHRFDWHV
jgi:hypothetical protein